MICGIKTAWQPFSNSARRTSMDPPDETSSTSGLERNQHGYASSESESRTGHSTSGKKRASRVGTRSVSTLSAAQLERKRANDREAQRAIRQRTKDHIDSLEKSVEELRSAQDANEKLISATQQRNRELEEENAYLRTRLSDVGYAIDVPRTGGRRSQNSSLFSIQSTSPPTQSVGSSHPRRSSVSTSSSLSLTNSQPSNPRHAPWQPAQNSFRPSAPSSASNLASTATAQPRANITQWRPNVSVSSVRPGTNQLAESSQGQTTSLYGTSNAKESAQWPDVPTNYSYPNQQSAHQCDSPSQAQQYSQPTIQGFNSANHSPQAAYQPQRQHAELQAINVTSPTSYPAPQQAAFPQSVQYQMTSLRLPVANSNYAAQHNHIQSSLLSTAPYHPPQVEQQYNEQQTQATMHFREDSGHGTYSGTHYPGV